MDESDEWITSSKVAIPRVIFLNYYNTSNKKLQSLVESAYRFDPRVQLYKEAKERERLEKEVHFNKPIW